MKRMATYALAMATPFALAACSDFENSLFSKRVNFSGPHSMVEPGFETLSDSSLCVAIAGSYEAGKGKVAECEVASPSGSSTRIDKAAAAFELAYAEQVAKAADEASKKPGASPAPNRTNYDLVFYIARNRIQDRLLAASEQRCDVYKNYLRRLDGSESFLFGGLATVLGGAGAIVTAKDGARILSGSAGVMSGLSAEAKAQIFANLASSVIVPGIEKARQDVLKDIMAKRCHSVATYTLELAMRDAMRFHGACSMDSGIATAGSSLQATKAPGLAAMKDALNTIKDIQKTAAQIAQGVKDTSSGDAGVTGGATAPKTDDAKPKDVAGDNTTSDSKSSIFEGLTIPTDCSVTVTSPAPEAPKAKTTTTLDVTYVVKADDDAAKIAAGLNSALTSSKDFGTAGIKAQTTGSSLIFTIPAGAKLTDPKVSPVDPNKKPPAEALILASIAGTNLARVSVSVNGSPTAGDVVALFAEAPPPVSTPTPPKPPKPEPWETRFVVDSETTADQVAASIEKKLAGLLGKSEVAGQGAVVYLTEASRHVQFDAMQKFHAADGSATTDQIVVIPMGTLMTVSGDAFKKGDYVRLTGKYLD